MVPSHPIQVPACMLLGTDKPVQGSLQEAHSGTSVLTPCCILWAGRETASSEGGPQTCLMPPAQALQGSMMQ